jgi:hypothetical protein
MKPSRRSVRRPRVRKTETRRPRTPAKTSRNAGALEIREIESLRSELDRLAEAAPPR